MGEPTSRENLDLIANYCLETTAPDPIEIAGALMDLPGIPMIGAAHHPLIAGAITAAYRNKTGQTANEPVLKAIERAAAVPAGFCAFYGADGAAIAAGAALSAILETNPTAKKSKERALTHTLTARALLAIADNQGTRCCKRSVFDTLRTTNDYFEEIFNLEYPKIDVKCRWQENFKFCNGGDCRYY